MRLLYSIYWSARVALFDTASCYYGEWLTLAPITRVTDHLDIHIQYHIFSIFPTDEQQGGFYYNFRHLKHLFTFNNSHTKIEREKILLKV